MNNNLKLLIIIVIILGGFLVWRTYSPFVMPVSSSYKSKIQSYKNDRINSVLFTKERRTLEFRKDNDKWILEGRRTDKSKIENLLNGLLPTGIPELISKTEAKHSDFSLTASTAAVVKLNDSLTFLLGKSAPISGVYARLESDPNVYVLNGISSYDLSDRTADWLDKTIFSTDKAKIKQLAFYYRKKNITLVKNNDSWTVEKTGTVPDKNKLEDILLTISSFTADSIPENSQLKNYPKETEFKMTVYAESGNESFDFFQGKTDVLVTRQSDKQEFLLSTATGIKFIDYAKSL